MGLLSAPLTLVRAPVRLTLRATEFGLSTAAEVARIGTELLNPNSDRHPSDFSEYRAAGYPNDGPATAPRRHRWRMPTGAVPDELIPDHVDEEPVLVAEVAEAGAEQGAGPELTVEAPGTATTV